MTLPYGANIDIRDAVKYKEVMKQYNLGLNGGILTSLNLFTTKFYEVASVIEKRADQLDYVLVDTPGQTEVFTWSASGPIITETFASTFPTVIAYVVDTPRSSSPITGAGMDAFFKIIDASADEYLEIHKKDLDKRGEEKQQLEEEYRQQTEEGHGEIWWRIRGSDWELQLIDLDRAWFPVFVTQADNLFHSLQGAANRLLIQALGLRFGFLLGV
ncbi:hypothetical protein MKW98_003002 [Papaver atlanticum]|uniref:GPN-loop GTPase n=1 Tax=Papaver atlanticum TaxID=357466 RepID=A0AAD4XZJ8_9MAGN|nr:hypothetical protein MKW98_003002 [Papaver atlanticum]